MSTREKSRAREKRLRQRKKSHQQKKAAPTKKKSHQQKKVIPQKKVTPAKKKRCTTGKRVCARIWCCTHTCMMLYAHSTLFPIWFLAVLSANVFMCNYVTRALRTTLRIIETNNASRKCISRFLHKLQQQLFSTIPDVGDYVTSHVFPLQLSLIYTCLRPNKLSAPPRRKVSSLTFAHKLCMWIAHIKRFHTCKGEWYWKLHISSCKSIGSWRINLE